MEPDLSAALDGLYVLDSTCSPNFNANCAQRYVTMRRNVSGLPQRSAPCRALRRLTNSRWTLAKKSSLSVFLLERFHIGKLGMRSVLWDSFIQTQAGLGVEDMEIVDVSDDVDGFTFQPRNVTTRWRGLADS